MNLSRFLLKDGVYCQQGFSAGDFENEYVSVRTKEGRMYDDDTVRKLPFVQEPEWNIRASSAKKLVSQLRKENITSFVEIGCGNGWLTNYIQRSLNIPAYGIDINKTELKQAARISNCNAAFIYGDIFSDAFNDLAADAIVLAACIQYFPDLRRLIDLLKHKGTVHIIDSPLYETGMASGAGERSRKYFDSKNAAGMGKFYFHHELDALSGAEFLYRPTKLKRLLGYSPFPWIRIRKAP